MAILRVKIFHIGLVAVLLTALVLRFWQLDSYPQGFSIDEAGFGYNAYSVLTTGKDEHGKNFPLAFEALGDYKPPVYVYLTTLSIATLGTTELAVRLWPALSGALSVILVILIIKELGFSRIVASATGFWLAVSPWHIFYSRGGYEVIISLFFVFLGIYAFLRARYTWSAFSFSVAVWTYTGQRIYVPLAVLILLLLFKEEVKNKMTTKKLVAIIVVLSIFIAPLLYLVVSGNQATARGMELWLFKGGQFNLFVWLGHYLSYFDPKFVFWKGLGLTPKGYQDMGLLYFFDLPLVVLGIASLVKSRLRKAKSLVLPLVLIGVLPASLTSGDPSPVRSLLIIPGVVIILAFAFEKILSGRKKYFLFIYILANVWGLLYFRDLYIYQFPKYFGDMWHWGYKEASLYACSRKNAYDKIIITDKYGHEIPNVKTVPPLYVLYFCPNHSAGNIEFRQPQWAKDAYEPNALLVGSIWDFPPKIPDEFIIKKIDFIDGKAAFWFVETRNVKKNIESINSYWR